MNAKIAVFSGDGIGPEVVKEGTEVLSLVASLHGFGVEWGGPLLMPPVSHLPTRS